MSIPKQVEALGKKADELLAAQNTPGASAEPQSATPPNDGEKPPAAAPAEQPPVESQPQQPKATDQAALEHRVKVLQGMLDKRNEEFRNLERTLNADIVARDRQINELNRRIVELEKKPDPPPAASQSLDEADLQVLEREGLSKEAADVLAKLTGQIVEQRTRDIKQKVETVTKDSHQARVDKFYDRLHSAVPDWQEVNADPQWNQWLSERVPGTNYTRQDIIDASQSKYDPTQVINLLNDFKKLVKWGAKKNKLEDKVEVITPSSQIASTTPGQGKIWTSAEIKKFYSNAAATKMSVVNPDEYNRTDQEIQQAMRDGRTQR